SRMHLNRPFLVAHVVEKPHDRSASFEASHCAVPRDEDGRQMTAIAVRELMRTTVVDSQKQCCVFLGRSALVQLVIQQRQQCSWGDFNALWPSGHHSA